MRTLTQLQQNRRVIEDFTVTTLAGIPGLFARLAYLASLRDLSSGRYEHAGLAALYPDAAIQQALQLCHEQIFERILETPLASQEEDLRACLAGMEGGLPVAVSHWRTSKLTASFNRKRRQTISRNFSFRISAHFWRFSILNILRLVQARNHTGHAAHNFGLLRHAPRLRYAM